MGGRSGWSLEETGFLFKEAKLAEASGRPIKSVFDKVASMTGRKPNSIRNYYYLKLKEDGDTARTAFTPFTDDEVKMLMKTMLEEQAKGRSVRGIAIEMGGGDKKMMLRYQNKYRSMLRMNPEYVRQIMDELKANGDACHDPFLRRPRPAGQDISVVITELIDNLSRTEVDADALLNGLLSLAYAAAKSSSGGGSSALDEIDRYKKENLVLRRRLESIRSITGTFAAKNGMERISSLSEYVEQMEALT